MPHRLHHSLAFSLTLFLTTAAGAQSSHFIAAGQSDTAFVLDRAGVVPENIVYDAPRDRFLGGDLERDGMIELLRDGSVRPFAEAGRARIASGVLAGPAHYRPPIGESR